MNTRDILSVIDAEIARLQSARSLLAGTASKRKRRPRKADSPTAPPAPSKRTMSAAGRKAIAEAQRKRWAKQKAAKK
jgi:hypothetical protein